MPVGRDWRDYRVITGNVIEIWGLLLVSISESSNELMFVLFGLILNPESELGSQQHLGDGEVNPPID